MSDNGKGSMTVHWPRMMNEHGGQMLWFGSWLVGSEGHEGTWFYSGRGDETASVSVPGDATGVRFRRWPSEGLEPEYVDIDLSKEPGEVWVERLDFDVRQHFSRLPR